MALVLEAVVLVVLFASRWAIGALCGIEHTPELQVNSPRDRVCEYDAIYVASIALTALVPSALLLFISRTPRPPRGLLLLIGAAVLAIAGELALVEIIRSRSPIR